MGVKNIIGELKVKGFAAIDDLSVSNEMCVGENDNIVINSGGIAVNGSPVVTEEVLNAYQPESNNSLIPITYSELKTLRDNAQLVAGQFYRITDYVCTTTQENTRAMENKFDIIVQALSSNTLSENASADYHIEGASGSVGSSCTFKSEVLADEDGTLVEGSVTPYYYEYIDYEGGGVEGLHEYKTQDIFVAYDYLENNEGVIVPVLYKTDEGYIDEGADYQDVFYYVGTTDVDGTTYNKWRKIFDSEDSNLTWDSEGKIYLYTNVIVNSGASDGDGYFSNAKLPAWELKYSLDNDTTRFAWAAEKTTIYTDLGFWFSNTGMLEHEGTNYYKWENSEWAGETECYLLSTTLDISAGDYMDYIAYATDGELNEFTYDGATVQQVSVSGKGVIYYMKDEWNNECPYDFKNIQFKRMVSLEKGYPEYAPENGEETWVYTFCGNSYHIDNDEWSELQDGSLESPYGHQSDEQTSTFHHNIIKPYIMLYDKSNEDSAKCGKMYLNNNVFFGYWEKIGSSSEGGAWYAENCCFSNTFGDYCYSNTFGNNCNRNTFGNGCHNNTFGNDCHNNTFGNECYSNTFGNQCYCNTFGNICSRNTFGDNCNNNTFGDDCDFNTFRDSCRHNTFGKFCFENIVGYSFLSNTFGNKCTSNTFGNNCNDNTFGNYCDSNTFGNNYTRNTFGNNCSDNIFGSSETSTIDYVRYVKFNNGCQYIKLLNTETGNSSNYVQDIVVSAGVRGTSAAPLELSVSRNAAPVIYETTDTTRITVG